VLVWRDRYHLTQDGSTTFEDLNLYKSTIDTLRYITLTHQKTAYVVNKIC